MIFNLVIYLWIDNWAHYFALIGPGHYILELERKLPNAHNINLREHAMFAQLSSSGRSIEWSQDNYILNKKRQATFLSLKLFLASHNLCIFITTYHISQLLSLYNIYEGNFARKGNGMSATNAIFLLLFSTKYLKGIKNIDSKLGAM